MATMRLSGRVRLLLSFAALSVGLWSSANAYADTWNTSNNAQVTTSATNTKVGVSLSPSTATPAGSLEVRSGTNSLDALVVNQAATGTQGAIARFRQSGTTRMLLTGAGNLAIGTVVGTLTEKLHVFGNVQVTGTVNADAGLKIKGQWSLEVPDYVFEAKYKPMGLSDLESYVRKNKHLPEVPSAAEMKSQGMDVATMNLTLLKKVEELTLYVIEQDKKIKELAAKVN
jgi:hypothetical protein